MLATSDKVTYIVHLKASNKEGYDEKDKPVTWYTADERPKAEYTAFIEEMAAKYFMPDMNDMNNCIRYLSAIACKESWDSQLHNGMNQYGVIKNSSVSKPCNPSMGARNRDGSIDYGLAMVNSELATSDGYFYRYRQALNKQTALLKDITLDRMMYDPFFNLELAAAKLCFLLETMEGRRWQNHLSYQQKWEDLVNLYNGRPLLWRYDARRRRVTKAEGDEYVNGVKQFLDHPCFTN